MDFASIDFIIIVLISLIISLSVHEFAHAFVSYKLWDPTPKIQKRLTLNPIHHLDPYWALMILFMVISWWWIWRWKPVQINPSYYKNPLKWELMVALAWPISNFILWIIWIFLLLLIWKIFWYSQIEIMNWFNLWILFRFFLMFAIVNFNLAIFNLLPIPPLDWFTIIKVLNLDFANNILKYQNYIMIWFLILILYPWTNSVFNFIWTFSAYLFQKIFRFLSFIFY